MKIKQKGTYVAIEGPQFSTYAESILYKSWNCDIIGMTNMPEVRLAEKLKWVMQVLQWLQIMTVGIKIMML